MQVGKARSAERNTLQYTFESCLKYIQRQFKLLLKLVKQIPVSFPWLFNTAELARERF